MADTAALKLGNLISSKIGGTLGSFASGMKGSFISANPAAFGPMTGMISKGFSGLTKQAQAQARAQNERTQREAGFREEAENERRKYEQILLSVQKGMAINIDSIQKDVRQILDVLSKQSESFWDKILAGLAGLGSTVGSFIGELLKPLKLFADKIGSVIDDIVKFFKGIPGRIGAAIDDIIRFFGNIPKMLSSLFDFLKNLPGRISSALNGIVDLIKAIPGKIGKFFSNLVGMFDDLIKKYLPNTRAAIGKFFSDLADILKFDKIKSFFTTQFDKLKKIFNFDDAIKAIGTKFNALIKLLDESEIAKAFRRIRNIFAISFAQYADDLEDLFNNKLMKSIGDVKNSIVGLGDRVMSIIDGAVDSLKSSRLVKFGEEFGGKIMSFFDQTVATARSTKLGTLANDILQVGIGIFKDIGIALKGNLGSMLPDMSELKTFFTLGKDALNMDELKYVMGEGGIIQKGAAMVGKFAGDAGRMFGYVGDLLKPIGEFFTGNNLLGKIAGMDEIAKILGWAGKLAMKGLKAIPFLAPIIAAIDGLMAAFDTEQIAGDLNKQIEDVNFGDRVSAFIAGILGGIVGLADLALMAINAVFDTSFKTDGPESIQSTVTSYFTKFYSDVLSVMGSGFTLLKGLITFDESTIKRAAGDIGNTLTGMMTDATDVFMSWVKTPLAKLNNALMGWIDGIVNGSIDWMIDKLSGPFMDKLPGTATAKEFLAGMKTNYAETNKADESAYVKGTGKDQTAAETARLGRYQKTAATSGAGSSGYTAADLKSMGINVRGSGDVQRPGAQIAGSTIAGAKYAQSNISGITFTGFNDAYHDKHSPTSSHTKGLAFDFTIPANAAMDNEYRKGIAQAISSSTGAKVIDEYAFPSAKSTGGHFHVDFGGTKGVDLGTGYFGGDKTFTTGAPMQPRGTGGGPAAQPPQAPILYERVNEYGEKYYTDIDGNVSSGAQAGATSAGGAQPQVRVVTRQKILSPEEALIYAKQIAYYDAEKKRYDEEKKYRDERAQLENQFYGDLEGMIRPMITALQGPAGSMDPALARDAGRNLAAGMQADFTRLGTTLFGKQYGAAMGTTFQKLAGSYLDQFINQALAPAMGIDAEVLNRSINLYAKGREFAAKNLAPAQKALDDAKIALQAKEKEYDISKASIIRASGLGKSLSPEQLSKIAELESMRKGVASQQSAVDELKKQRKQYNQAALEDLFFGMTGVATGPRSLIEKYGGADALTSDLATLVGAPFSPAFRLGEKGPLTGPGVDPRIALDQRLKQTEEVIVTSGEAVAVKASEGVTLGATNGARIFRNEIEAGASVIVSKMSNALSGIGVSFGGGGGGGLAVNLGSVTGQDMDAFTSGIGESVASSFEKLATSGAGGGTAISGYVEDGSYDRAETAKFLRQAATGGIGGVSGRSTVNTGKLMDFGQNMLYSMMGSKVSSAFGGGMAGNIMGRAATGAMRGAFKGGDIVQNIGDQFGMKLPPGAGFGDLIGGINSMFSSPLAGMGKMGMNLLGKIMGPGGPTSALGEMGMNLFSGMQASGNFMGNLGSMFGKGGSFGTSFGAGMGGAGNFAGQALGALGTGFQGYGISKALSGGYSTGGNTVNAIAGIASMIPGIGPLAGVIGGLVNRAFGRKAKEIKAAGFSGTFSGEGANIQKFSDWSQKGGWFRSDKKGTTMSAVDAETAKAFSDTVKDTTKTVESLGKVLGYDPTKTKGFSKAVKIDLKGLNEQQQQQAIQKAFQDYGASLVGSSFKYIGGFTKTGEDQLDTLTRLASATDTFKAVMTGPDVKKMLGLDSADAIKNILGTKFGAVTNMDAAITDYLGGGKGMMEVGTSAGTNAIAQIFGGKDGGGGWFRNLTKSVQEDVTSFGTNFSSAFRNVFAKLNIDPVSDVAGNIVSSFTNSLENQAGSLQEYLNTYIADFQSQLIEAYGGEEEFKRVESSLFDLLYTEEEKKIKMQEITAQQMNEAAQTLKDAGVAIDPETLSSSFEDNRLAVNTMLKVADADLASGKITKDQYATIRKSAADFLIASKKNSELVAAGGVTAASKISAEEASKYMFPIQNAVAAGTMSIATASTDGSEVLASTSTATANTVAVTAVAAANTAAEGISDSVSAIENMITEFINSSSTFANAVGGLNGSIGTLENAVSNFDVGGADGAASGGGGGGANAEGGTGDTGSDGIGVGGTGDGDGGSGGAAGGGEGGSSGGEGGSSGCVDPEVPLYISSTETKPAGDVVVGDYMYTVHEKTLEYGMYKVINAQLIIQDKIVVTFDDATQMKISTTHKFLLSDGSWKEMYLLDVGAQIQTMHGVNENGYKTITRIDDIGDGEVVLLTVEDAHTYIADGLISHNMKARGGAVRKTKPYIIGEVGPEIFVPNMAGTIIPTHRIIEAVQNASSLDTQTRNLLMSAKPAPNPISMAYLAQEQSKKYLEYEKESSGPVTNAVVDNSVTQVSSPQTTVINSGGEVRSNHPISGMFTRNMIGARGFGS